MKEFYVTDHDGVDSNNSFLQELEKARNNLNSKIENFDELKKVLDDKQTQIGKDHHAHHESGEESKKEIADNKYEKAKISILTHSLAANIGNHYTINKNNEGEKVVKKGTQ